MKREQARTPLTLFYSYAQQDELLRAELEKHLRQLSREGLISTWWDRMILPGENRAQEIDAHLETASVVLLLVSPDFLASDYCYEIEMQRALERHKRGEARVIPIILRPCDWKHAPFAFLECLPLDGKAITLWNNQDEAFLNVVQGLRRVIERARPSAQHLTATQRENRARLIKRVRTTWIEGFLEHSLHQATWLTVGLQEQPDALDNPWEMLVQEFNREPRPLPAGTSIVQVYDQADGRLLILGEPGAGKTTSLLQLTRTLLERADNDILQPLPVVFVLSSWARKRQALATWIVDELKVRYHIPPAIAQRLLDEQQIIPVLDGLDEVAANVRVACVQAINAYIQQYLDQKNIPIVVACRRAEYMNLSTRVTLQKAVSILPLSKEQVESYLQKGGERVDALRQALRTDPNLAEMARTPLLLSVFVLAYIDAQSGDLPLALSREETLQILFATYIRRMFSRRGVLRTAGVKQAIEQLTFLAKQMRHYEQTVFSVETLQPDGLTKRQKLFFRLSTPLRVGLTFYLVVGLISGLAWGLVEVQRGLPLDWFFSSLVQGGGVPAIIIMIPAMIVSWLFLLRQDGGNAVPIFTYSTRIGGRTVYMPAPYHSAMAHAPQRRMLDIQPREIMTWDWSWKNVLFGLGWAMVIGPFNILLVAPPFGIIFLLALACMLMFFYGGVALWLSYVFNSRGAGDSERRREVRFVLFWMFAAALFIRLITWLPGVTSALNYGISSGVSWTAVAGPLVSVLTAPPFVVALTLFLFLGCVFTFFYGEVTAWFATVTNRSIRVGERRRKACFVLFWVLATILFIRWITWLLGVEVGTIFGLPIGMIIMVFKVISSGQELQRVRFRPNEGIKRSGRNGLLLGLILTASFCLPLMLALWFSFRTPESMAMALELGLTIGLSLGLYFGLNAFFQHYTLRFWFWLFDYLPWNIVVFLDEMAERLFLRRVGGSYMFIHRFLLDYFAALAPAQQEQLAGSATARTPLRRAGVRNTRLAQLATKRRIVALLAMVCLLVFSVLFVNLVHVATLPSDNLHAGETALVQSITTYNQSLVYPTNFPGHGTISVDSSLHAHDINLPTYAGAACQPQKKGYLVAQTGLNTSSFCGYDESMSDIAISVSMNILTGDCGGVALRTNLTGDTGYLFYLCKNNTYGLLQKFDRAPSKDLIPSTSLPTALLQINKLALVARGNTLTLFLNGYQLNAVQDSRYTNGSFGLAIFDRQKATSVFYQGIRVWKIIS
ncbi:NACHT domain-containing protein [Dictyobacter kobayashii]|uniref:Uncharacterized protein n=1 Tax=Dictyobacter kobayashii TaxID=2014872 RepID=A0A402ANT7_9CHLR|nr:TIR domain-containing protein [Dictyobacter kobayashii]GCE20823.1 hypothetical protein KDK_46230 [Dictyobacter kobayashii]